MIRIGLLAGTLAIVASSTHALAQADLAPLAAKTTFNRDDIARIGTAADELARKFGGARDPAAQARILTDLRKLLDDSKTTVQFKTTFGVEYARAFEPFFTTPTLSQALGAVIILEKVSSPQVRDKFVAILTSSPLPAVRYWAVKGLRSALASAKDAKDVEGIIEVLGQQGATESEPLVLTNIYDLLLWAAGQSKIGASEQVARAVATVLDARAAAPGNRIGQGANDSTGYAAAAAAYPAVKGDVAAQRKLVLGLARHLAYYGRRYGRLGPAGGGVALKEGAKACEDALVKIVQSAGGTPPSAAQRLAAKISAGAPAKDVQDALAAWIGASGKPGVLNGDPWKAPVGLSQ